MDDMSSSTQLKPMFKPKGEKPSPQSLFLFVTSIARTNLEVELVQRGGSLVSSGSDPPNPLLPKRDCIGKWSSILLGSSCCTCSKISSTRFLNTELTYDYYTVVVTIL